MNQEAKVISLSYELRHGHADGEIIEVVNKEKPAEFLFGTGQLNPKFEENVGNLSENETFEFVIPADEAYGKIDQAAIVDLPKDVFVVDGKLAEDLLVVGNMINMQDQNGNPLRGKITEIGTDKVKMDFNHPLAGLDLHFKGEILGSREATKEEVDHGHVHTGQDGH